MGRSKQFRRLPWLVLFVIAAMTAATASAWAVVPQGNVRPTFSHKGGLDCNGFSTVQQSLKLTNICADPTGYDHGRAYDNGHYIGHDEPSIQFNSKRKGSGNNVRWKLTLPRDHPLPATQNFENFPAFWLSMALCDPNSFPQNPCIPDSDKNTGVSGVTSAGSAFLEMQFYPPGFSPFISQISCDQTHWCASLHINSLECTQDFEFCNNACFETTNFAFIQMNGVPTGPAGPANQTAASFTPNKQTLLMNPGDKITATIHDTAHGVLTRIYDRTTGKSGFMVASAKNGYQSLDVNTCAPTLFDFHPEYSTAKVGNWVPWAALQANIGFSQEIGHFEPGTNGDNDPDDPPCFPGPTLPGCLNFAQGGDLDFDGTSYLPDWADGTTNTPEPVRVSAPNNAQTVGGNYNRPYPKMQFETEAPASDSNCDSTTGQGCVVPPTGAVFYPFYSATAGKSCDFLFGNDVAGLTARDFGKLAQYGSPNLAWFPPTLSGGIRNNPC